MSLMQEFQSLISSSDSLYIYGAGKIGKKIFSLIDALGMKWRVKAFLVTDLQRSDVVCMGVPVLCIDSFLDKKALVLISVTEVYHADVLKKLEGLKITNYINAFKYRLLDINCDESVFYISLKDLLEKLFHKNDYVYFDIVIRLLAVENMYEKNDYGVKLYKKLMDSFYGDYGTSCAPSDIWLCRFKNLVANVERNGFLADSEIEITKDFFVANGRHRLSLAIFYSVPKIKVAQFSDYKGRWFAEADYQKCFSNAEMILIKNRLSLLKKEYGII